jgi:hypothetical protein
VTVHAIHHDCVVCLTTERSDLSPAEAVKVVLMMLARDIPGDQIVRDLSCACFTTSA